MKSDFDKIRNFVADFSRIQVTEIKIDSRLSEDLGIEGDDAVELLEAYSSKFGIDMTEFKFSKHFLFEGFNPFYEIYCLLFARDKLKKMPVLILDLVNALESKEWPKIE